MGKKRIKTIGAEGASKEDKQKKIRTGKESSRLTDMGAIALAEAEELKQKEAELEKLVKSKAKEGKKETKKPARKRGKKYSAARKLVDRSKFYSLGDAVKLLKKTSISQFKGTVELHLNLREKGLKKEIKLPYPKGKAKILKVATEKKVPLAHLVIGKLDAKEAELVANLKMIIDTIGRKNIHKAVLTSTMGPGIKLALD